MRVFVRDNNVDQALKVLKRKMQREGVFREMKRRRFYEKGRADEEERQRQVQAEARQGAAKERIRQEAEANRRAEQEQEQAFAAAKRTDNFAAFDAFLASYGGSRHTTEARTLRAALVARDEAFNAAMASDDAAVLKAFLKTYPNDSTAKQVLGRLQGLQWKQVWRPKRRLLLFGSPIAVALVGSIGAWLIWGDRTATTSSPDVGVGRTAKTLLSNDEVSSLRQDSDRQAPVATRAQSSTGVGPQEPARKPPAAAQAQASTDTKPQELSSQAPAAAQVPTDGPLVYSPWSKVCNAPSQNGQDAKAPKVCVTGREARTDTGVTVVAATLIEPDGGSKKIFRVTVRGPVQLQYGSRIIVDSNDPSTSQFVTCFAHGGCMSDFDGTPELIAKLKKGQTLSVQAINLAGTQISLSVPLADFAQVNAGPPMESKAFEEQQKKLPQAAAPAQAPTNGPLVYSPWTKFCSTPGQSGQDAKAPKVCFTGRDGRTETGVPVVAAALIEPADGSKKILRVTVPSPVQLQYGTRMVIDSNEPSTSQFFACFTDGCISDTEATAGLIAQLRNGKTLSVQAINLAGTQISFSVPLADFGQVNAGPPMDPKAFEEQQKKLQEGLQKKAYDVHK